MTQFLRQTFFAALACVFPGAAWAQLTNTVSLTANTALNLDTGATGTTGASILWTGSQISFQGSAKGYSLGPEGSATYAALTQSTLPTFASLETTAAIPAATLVVGEVFIVTTVGGNPAKLLVAGVSGTTITLTYTTYGVAAAPAGPTITGVTNNYSYTPAGFANSGISPGSLFVIFGTGLSTSTTAVLQNTLVGLPATLNGASVSVTVGGITVHPGLYYAVASAIAAVLPSSTPTGSGTMTVTNGTTSAAFSIQVVASAMGFDTYYGTGNGLLVVTDPSGNLITYTNSAKPGNTYTLWGSGLGADTADSDTVFTGTPHAVSTPFALYVGNQLATVSYKGSSGYPGVGHHQLCHAEQRDARMRRFSDRHQQQRHHHECRRGPGWDQRRHMRRFGIRDQRKPGSNPERSEHGVVGRPVRDAEHFQPYGHQPDSGPSRRDIYAKHRVELWLRQRTGVGRELHGQRIGYRQHHFDFDGTQCRNHYRYAARRKPGHADGDPAGAGRLFRAARNHFPDGWNIHVHRLRRHGRQRGRPIYRERDLPQSAAGLDE